MIFSHQYRKVSFTMDVNTSPCDARNKFRSRPSDVNSVAIRNLVTVT